MPLTGALARILATRLQTTLKQPFVVENRPGAGGTIGLASVAKAPADGYTLVIGEPGAYSINPSFLKHVGYDPVRDFVPVAALTELQLVIVANPATRIRSLKDLAGFGGGKSVLFGSAGVGTVQHLSMELLKRTMKLEMTHVAYKGGSPAMMDLIGGHLPLLPVTVSTALQPANAGQVVPIAALCELWPRKLILKGILRPDDAATAVSYGVDGVLVSNHGGRTVDSALAPIEALPAIVRAIAGKATVLLDSGIRRGSDVLKALALGADGVLIGRPTLFGTALAGRSGAARALQLLRTEIEREMGLTGCRQLSDFTPDLLAFAGA